MAEPLERDDIQGIVARAYPELPAANYLLLSIEDGAAAARRLGTLADTVSAGAERPEAVAVNVAFTSHGLARLGLPPQVLQMFSMPFLAGRARPAARRAAR